MAKEWRLLSHKEGTGAWNMGVDESLLHHCRPGNVPVLRFYRWNPATLSLGYFQNIDEINLAMCNEKGIDIIRRPTGGRAVLHMHELTYSVIAPFSDLPGSLIETYRFLSSALATGLLELGLEAKLAPARRKMTADTAACFDAPGTSEITINGRKAVGSAQTRRGNALLQHGSIPLCNNNETLVALLNLETAKKERLMNILEKKSTTLTEEGLAACNDYLALSENVEKALVLGFKRIFQIDFRKDELQASEIKKAEELVKDKYSRGEWNLKRGLL